MAPSIISPPLSPNDDEGRSATPHTSGDATPSIIGPPLSPNDDEEYSDPHCYTVTPHVGGTMSLIIIGEVVTYRASYSVPPCVCAAILTIVVEEGAHITFLIVSPKMCRTLYPSS